MQLFSELNKMRDSLSGPLQHGMTSTQARVCFTLNGFDANEFDFMGTNQKSEMEQEIFLRSMLTRYLSKNEGIQSDSDSYLTVTNRTVTDFTFQRRTFEVGCCILC